MRNAIFLFLFLVINNVSLYAQYNEDQVEIFSTNINGKTYSVVKMIHQNNRIKVKYFSVKDKSGLSSYLRYESWAKNKNIIAYMSAGYITDCASLYAHQVGLTIDNGEIINSSISENLGGLAVIQNDEIKLFNLENPFLQIKDKDGVLVKFELRNAFDRSLFIKWASENNISAFQCHLLAQNDSLLVYENAAKEIRDRRFLIGGVDQDGLFSNYILNLNGPETLRDATKIALKFLKSNDGLQAHYIINHDAGCDNIFRVFNANGEPEKRRGFEGFVHISNAASLIVFYYE
jgi:hypothetical protein